MENELENLIQLVNQGKDFPSLLEKNFPMLIPDINEVSDFIYADLDDSTKAQAIKDAYSVKTFLEKNRPHDKKHELHPYDCYLKIQPDKGKRIDKASFQSLLSSISAISLNNNALRLNDKTNRILDELSSLGLTKTETIDFISSTRSGQGTEHILYRIKNSGAVSNLDSRINKVSLSINHNPMALVDSICSLSHQDDLSDDVIECKFILNKVIEACLTSCCKSICFLNANPYFIRTIMSKTFFKSYSLSFCLEDELLEEILKNHYSLSNASFIKLDNLLSYIYEEGHYPDLTVVFCNRSEIIYNSTIDTLPILIDSAPDVHTLMVFDSDTHIKTSTSVMHNILKDTDIESIDLIPDSIPSSTFPKRKALIKCQYGFVNSNSTSFELHHYSYINQNGFPATSCKAFITSMTYEEFSDSSITMRGKYRDEKLRYETKTTSKLNQPSSFFFSPEICFFVNVSGQGTGGCPYRLSAYARTPKTSNTKPLKIILTSASTKLTSASDVEKWVTKVYPFTKTKWKNEKGSVRSAISKEYKPFFKDKFISLKTFLYIYEEFEKAQPNEISEEIRFWMESPLGEYRLDMITPVMLEEFLFNSYISNQRSISYHQSLEIFRRVFSLAIKYNHCKENPANTLLNQRFEVNEDIYDINAALKRKMLYKTEINRITNKYNEIYDTNRPLSIALYMQLLLGLEPNISCAFLWSDFKQQSVKGKTFYTLYIRRQLNTEGTQYLQFKRREFYRTIPLPKFLADILLSEKAFQAETIAKGNEKYLEDCSIITGKDYVLNGQALIMAPRTVYKESSKILKTLKAPDIILTIPSDNGGTTETNLSYYGSDLFRNNFRHYICYNNSEERRIMTNGEYRYLAGLKGPDTFSRNYCDYGNLQSLEILQKKLERLTRRMMK